MRSSCLGLLAAAFALSLLPQPAEALSKYQLTKPSGYKNYRVDVVRSTPTGTIRQNNVMAGPFQLNKDGNRNDGIIAWCFDLDGRVKFGKSYGYEPDNFLTQPQRDRIQTLFDASYHEVDTSPIETYAGQGFQLAVWNTIYDNDYDLFGGAFKVTDQIKKNNQPTSRAWHAQRFLQLADNYGNGPQKWTITELQAGKGVQMLGTATIMPMPLPAAAWMLLAAAGGLFVAKRRRSGSA